MSFGPPDDRETPIWRYQSFVKLLSLLQTKELYFARPDTLGDPFEGSISKANIRGPDEPPGLEGFAKTYRLTCAVSCWHISKDESAAMWKLYGGDTEVAVALKSSTNRLISSLQAATENVWIGVVQYIDYDTDPIPEENIYYPILHKRHSFAHEHELRAVVQFPQESSGTTDLTLNPPGLLVSVDVSALVEAILVAPQAPSWCEETVRAAVISSGFASIPVLQSRIGEEPLF